MHERKSSELRKRVKAQRKLPLLVVLRLSTQLIAGCTMMDF